MGEWSRQEIEAAFAGYQDVSARAARTGDWNEWADLFTEDVHYVEHLYGEMHGREAVREWITETMTTPPGSDMDAFPVAWYVIDEERGWVVMCVWNRFRDPGDGSVHQAYNFSLLKYAGDGKWSYEEDIYNPATFGTALRAWTTRKAEIESG